MIFIVCWVFMWPISINALCMFLVSQTNLGQSIEVVFWSLIPLTDLLSYFYKLNYFLTLKPLVWTHQFQHILCCLLLLRLCVHWLLSHTCNTHDVITDQNRHHLVFDLLTPTRKILNIWPVDVGGHQLCWEFPFIYLPYFLAQTFI